MSTAQLVWLITGTSSGFGAALTLAALKRGDKVIATARLKSLNKLDALKAAGAATLPLDVTDSLDSLKTLAEQAIKIYGKVDVVVNNAAYIASGTLEENTPEETVDQFNTNVFGVLNVTRAFLPYMRARKSGKVIMIGSEGGWGGYASCGLYAATKFAIRGLAESLDMEISPLGLRCHYIEPGMFRTDFLSTSHYTPYVTRIPDYEEPTRLMNSMLQAANGKQPGDPEKLVEVMIDLVKGEGVMKGRQAPRGLPLGSGCGAFIGKVCGDTLQLLEDWDDVIKSTDFPKGT